MRALVWLAACTVVGWNKWHAARLNPLAPYEEHLLRSMRIQRWQELRALCFPGKPSENGGAVARAPRFRLKITLIYQ